MTVGCKLSVNGLSKLKIADNCGRTQVKDLIDGFGKLLIGDLAGSVGIDHDGYGTSNADSVRKLNKALVGKAGRDDVLCNIA